MLFSLLLFVVNVWAAENADITVKVKGMVCSFCIQGVEKKFSGQDSVEKFTVDLEKSHVSLWLKEGKDIADDKIKKLILDAGYDVEQISRLQDPPKSDPPKSDPPTEQN